MQAEDVCRKKQESVKGLFKPLKSDHGYSNTPTIVTDASPPTTKSAYSDPYFLTNYKCWTPKPSILCLLLSSVVFDLETAIVYGISVKRHLLV